MQLFTSEKLRLGYLLDFIQQSLDILWLFQVRFENGWRGSTSESLPNYQDSRALEGGK
jgi:hypothetical protein